MKYLFTIITAFCLLQAWAQPERKEIAPLVQTTWGLRAPYYNLCPVINGQHCETGCVATAMAQVMRYYQHPKESPAIPGYTTSAYHIVMDELPATTFDWDNMTLTYGSGSTDAERTAVATLMLYCGAAVQMDYTPGGSAAWESDAMVALESLFGYALSTRELYRYMFDDLAWENILYNELRKGRPIIYGGMPSGLEHQFICDGYKNGKFHFNMGWTFKPSGYYGINEIDEYNFHSAIVGIKKGDGVVYGRTFTIGSLAYTIIDSDEVSVCSDKADKPQGDVVIPAMVTHEGQTYHVTMIEYEAFSDNSDIRSLSIPASVMAISREAIKNCSNLSTITVDEGNTSYHVVNGCLMNITDAEVIARTATAIKSVRTATVAAPSHYYTPLGIETPYPRGLVIKSAPGQSKKFRIPF